MYRCEIDYYTRNGDCDSCIYGIEGECHLQCTQEADEECTDDCVDCPYYQYGPF